MSKKEELLEEAKNLGIDLPLKATIKDIEAKIKELNSKTTDTEIKVAKAGKRSSKALKEKEELLLKEEHKKDTSVTVSKPKPKTRPLIERRSKNYRNSYSKIDSTKVYPLGEAISVLKTTSKLKFDQTVELHIRLNVDPRHADQNIRDNVVLPFGNGKKIKIAVYTESDTKGIEADKVGGAELLQEIDKGNFDFDVLITTPDLMPKLARYAKVLGPKGLMPNPKSGTVTTDLSRAVSEAKAGKIEYRVDSNGIVHSGIGKLSFEDDKLLKNIETILNSIKNNKPNSVKSSFIKSIYLTTTMGPSVAINDGSSVTV